MRTYHAGSQAERTALRKKLRRDLARKQPCAVKAYINGLLEWVRGRYPRYKKRKGGL